jgi:hypothetical protein
MSPILTGVIASGVSGNLTPNIPTIGTATAGDASASVTFTPSGTGPAATSYTVVSSPGSLSATGSSSPLTVTGLTNGTAYTFTVYASNALGNSAASAASNSITPAASGDFESIASATPAGVSSVTFSSIPSTYKHLQIRITARSTVTNNQQEISFTYNGDTSGNYGRHILWGDGSSISVDGRGSTDPANYLTWIAGNAALANVFGIMIIDVLDYTNTAKTRTVAGITGLDRNSGGLVGLISGNYNGTSAVSSINVANQGGFNFIAGSSIALYGIKG